MQAHAGACKPDASQSQGLGPFFRVLEAFFMIFLYKTPTLSQNRFFQNFRSKTNPELRKRALTLLPNKTAEAHARTRETRTHPKNHICQNL